MSHDETKILRIEPFRSVGPLRLGASRDSCREYLGQPDESYRRSAWEVELADSYLDFGITLDFGPGGLLEAVEMFPPARPVLEGIDLLGLPGRDVLRLLSERASTPEFSLGVYNFDEFGISLFSSSGPASDGLFDSVSVFRRGIPAQPDFFGKEAELPSEPISVSVDGIGEARLGMGREGVRSLFGEGMAADYYGWSTDIFFAGIVAQYDAAGIARRIVATAPLQVSFHGNDVLRTPFREFVRTVVAAMPDCVVSRAAVTLGRGGPQVLISRAGADDLPISAVSVGALT
ncbi:hypothetical protein [Streptomyces bauhiniae]|uniref:Uncharacterized protein n=1 Tax=Streptomyces bauhiniae TaxID=2340725 RepID=A0A7K3QW25_9ACTN|nr:hypothetical protein [Streptomyces bauhiniae]NEB94076.1 hypothetical protein [Streptomyces bauhiniae]